jgi:hypothetical protein
MFMLLTANKNRRAAIWTGIILTAGLWTAISGSAAAGTHQSHATSGRATAGSGQHCVVNLSDNNKTTCHGSFRAAIADATEGHITDAPQNPATAARDAAFESRINALATTQHNALSSYVLSIEYTNVNFSGESHVFVGWDICGDTSYSVPDASLVGWNDKTSSFAAYSECWVKHFENTSFTGARTDFLTSAATLGVMNGATSSILWQALNCPPYCAMKSTRGRAR